MLILMILLASCDHHSAPQPAAAVRERVSVHFAAADFLKPEPGVDPGFDVYMAPLLVVERAGAEGVDGAPIGALVSRGGALEVDRSRPTVYFAWDTVEIHGREHDRVAYLWFFPRAPDADSGSPFGVQGVRLTLGSAGFPVLQEVLLDRSGLVVLTVAERLEEAARREHGDPLPGCRHAIERDAGRAVVARLAKMGPTPTAPFVYVRPPDHEVTALLCRCEPVQFGSVANDINYRLEPMESLADVGVAPSWSAEITGDAGDPAPSDPAPSGESRSLERALRLPREL